MKTLWLVRHAKSSKKSDTGADHDRPLNKRGKQDAPRLGEFFRERQLVPDLIVTSTAKRARKTASKIAKACGYEGIIEVTGALYPGPPGQYVQVLRHVPDHVEQVMVVGHNPGAEALLAQLTGQMLPLPTAAVAHVELELEHWRQMTDTTRGRLVDVQCAKELK
ncbi:MAG: SixA phosphatase family protein [Planctomycetota bacterium]